MCIFILFFFYSCTYKGGALEEEPAGMENVEHDIDNNVDRTAEGNVQKDDFTAEKTETADGSSETSRTIEVPNHRVLSFYCSG